MAEGIDTIAHESALNSTGNTIALLPCGFNASKSRKIFNEILNANGLILSEYFPDMPSFKSNFSRRNELISVLSDGVVVIEAHEKSGTLITGKHALKHSTPLFSFPENINNQNFVGNNYLLTHGANCICSYKDILNKYPNINFKKKKIQNLKTIPVEFSHIYEKLTSSPQNINTLSNLLNIPLQDLQYKLTLMELEDLTLKLANNCYIKI